MAQLDHSTISIKTMGLVHSIKSRMPKKDRRSYWGMIRNIGIAFLMLLAVGWGAWRFVGTPANVEDDESIADLDGFDSAPQFVKSQKTKDNSTAQLGEAAMLPPLNPIELDAEDQGR